MSEETIIQERRGSLALKALIETEQKFFDLVNKGDVSAIQAFIQNNRGLNINSANFQELTALHIAIKNENQAVVQLLIGNPDIDFKDAALYAVETGNVTIVQTILDAMNRRVPQSEFKSYEDSAEFSKDITPLILAAHHGHFDMIRMLMERGHKITRPHLPKCLCSFCKQQITEASYNLSRIRLNCYKALSNPAYICQTSLDPIFYGFHLGEEMKTCEYTDKEFRADYATLSDDLRMFLVDLISCCRNPAEIEMILKQKAGYDGSGKVAFPRLLMALDCYQKEFVAHSLVQQVLNAVWLDGYKSWNRYSIPEMGLRVLMRVLLLPFLAILMIVYPSNKFSQKLVAPVNKYISSLSAHLVFVFLLYIMNYIWQQQPKTRGTPKTHLEIFIVIFTLGYTWDSLRQLWMEGYRRYFKELWHWYDLCMEIMLFMTFIFWWRAAKLAAYEKSQQMHTLERKFWNSYDPNLIHEGLFAISCILAFGRFGFFFLQSSRLGPLQVSMGKMAIQIFYFMIFCFLLITSFAIPVATLYNYYDGMIQVGKDGVSRSQLNSFTNFINSFGTFFWAIFGMSPKESVDVVIENLDTNKINPKLNHHEFTEGVGRLLFSIYEVLMLVALLNTLIAILSNTFQKVVDNADIEWKFARTKLWVYFFHEASTLPPPLNLIPSVSGILSCGNFCLTLCKLRPGKVKFSGKGLCYIENDEEPDDKLYEYEALMTSLAQRYFRLKAEGGLEKKPPKKEGGHH